MCDPGRGSWFGRARVTTKKQCGWNKQASAASRQTTRLLPLHLLLILLWYLWTRPTFWDTSKAHNELILRIIDTSHTSSNQPRSMDLLPLHLQIVSSYWVHGDNRHLKQGSWNLTSSQSYPSFLALLANSKLSRLIFSWLLSVKAIHLWWASRTFASLAKWHWSAKNLLRK